MMRKPKQRVNHLLKVTQPKSGRIRIQIRQVISKTMLYTVTLYSLPITQPETYLHFCTERHSELGPVTFRSLHLAFVSILTDTTSVLNASYLFLTSHLPSIHISSIYLSLSCSKIISGSQLPTAYRIKSKFFPASSITTLLHRHHFSQKGYGSFFLTAQHLTPFLHLEILHLPMQEVKMQMHPF